MGKRVRQVTETFVGEIGPRNSDSHQIYLDYAASAPIDERVLSAVTKAYRHHFANPSSRDHVLGRAVGDAIEAAREQVAVAINAFADEIVFTSGATESNSLAIFGMARAATANRNHLVTCVAEHASVLEAFRTLEATGRFDVTYVGVDRDGCLDIAQLRECLSTRTLLVSAMWVNNELGSINDVGKISDATRRVGAVFHCDATQAVGRVPVDVAGHAIDLMSLSGHKLYGPRGIGALFVRDDAELLQPLFAGGQQEGGLRPGTQHTPGIVGMGRACEIARNELHRVTAHLRALTKHARTEISRLMPQAVFVSPDDAVPGLLCVAFPGVDGQALLARTPRLSLSLGSACSGHQHKPSHVLTAIGLAPELMNSAVRISMGRPTTQAQITNAISDLHREVTFLEAFTPKHDLGGRFHGRHERRS